MTSQRKIVTLVLNNVRFELLWVLMRIGFIAELKEPDDDFTIVLIDGATGNVLNEIGRPNYYVVYRRFRFKFNHHLVKITKTYENMFISTCVASLLPENSREEYWPFNYCSIGNVYVDIDEDGSHVDMSVRIAFYKK